MTNCEGMARNGRDRRLMNPLSVSHSNAVTRLAEILQEAVDLLGDSDLLGIGDHYDLTPESSLVEQCIELARTASTAEYEPIRTLHHFACTGGTVISQSIAAMPNVQLLSEVDRLSPLESAMRPATFAPTNMHALLQRGTRPVPQELLLELFRAQLNVAYQQARAHGTYLVI